MYNIYVYICRILYSIRYYYTGSLLYNSLLKPAPPNFENDFTNGALKTGPNESAFPIVWGEHCCWDLHAWTWQWTLKPRLPKTACPVAKSKMIAHPVRANGRNFEWVVFVMETCYIPNRPSLKLKQDKPERYTNSVQLSSTSHRSSSWQSRSQKRSQLQGPSTRIPAHRPKSITCNGEATNGWSPLGGPMFTIAWLWVMVGIRKICSFWGQTFWVMRGNIVWIVDIRTLVNSSMDFF